MITGMPIRSGDEVIYLSDVAVARLDTALSGGQRHHRLTLNPPKLCRMAGQGRVRWLMPGVVGEPPMLVSASKGSSVLTGPGSAWIAAWNAGHACAEG